MKHGRTARQKRTQGVLVSKLTAAVVLAVASPLASASSRAYALANVYDWTQHDNELYDGELSSTAMSASGQYVILGTYNGGEGYSQPSPLYVSSDYGTSWTNVAESIEPGVRNYWQSVDVSNDGHTMVAASDHSAQISNLNSADGNIFISDDSGDTWSDITPSGGDDWQSVAISGDGSEIVALSNDDTDNVYISDDGGANWETSSVSNVDRWHSLAVSDNGSKILVGGENTNSLSQLVYYSNNSGGSWANVSQHPSDLGFSTQVAMSSSGDKLAIASDLYDGGGFDEVVVSTNDGANWTDITPDDEDENPWMSFAVSDDGTVFSLVDYYGKMYVSTNGGTSWTLEDFGEAEVYNSDHHIDLNTDGSRVVVASADLAFTGYSSELTEGGSDSENSVTLSGAEGGKSIRLVTPEGTTITCSTPVKESVLSKLDADYKYPAGLVDFCFSTPDSSNEVTLTFVTDLTPGDVVARKYNPLAEAYSDVSGVSITETTYEGHHALQATYTIVDNGPLDTDLDEGEIADPIGLAVADTGVPNTGLKHMDIGLFALSGGLGAVLLVSLAIAPARRKIASMAAKK